MLIATQRFGNVQIPEEKIITMIRPILGFEILNEFCLIESDDMAPFMWLQSIEEPAIAFIIVNPRVFFPDYRIEINRKEIADLKIADVEAVETYVIITAASDPAKMSANLQGPVLINTANNLARQLVMVNSEYGVTHSILEQMDKLEKAPSQGETAPVSV